MSEDDGQAAAGAAIRAALADSDRSQSWLGAEVAAREGRVDPYSQSNVFEWLAGTQPIPPTRMFLIEKILGKPRGSISRLVGYIPADLRPQPTVVAALEADQGITDDQRAMLLAAYEAARSQKRSRRRRR